MSKRLTLPKMQETLGELFELTSEIALGADRVFTADTRIAAAQASAQLAGMLIGAQELKLMGMTEIFDPTGDLEEEGFDSDPE